MSRCSFIIQVLKEAPAMANYDMVKLIQRRLRVSVDMRDDTSENRWLVG
jgi:hypothetical protein